MTGVLGLGVGSGLWLGVGLAGVSGAKFLGSRGRRLEGLELWLGPIWAGCRRVLGVGLIGVV